MMRVRNDIYLTQDSLVVIFYLAKTRPIRHPATANKTPWTSDLGRTTSQVPPWRLRILWLLPLASASLMSFTLHSSSVTYKYHSRTKCLCRLARVLLSSRTRDAWSVMWECCSAILTVESASSRAPVVRSCVGPAQATEPQVIL